MNNNEMQVYNPNQAVVTNQFSDEGFDIVADMTTAKTQFTSVVAETDEDRARLFNAMNNPDERISNMINMTINAKDLYIEVVQCTNTETGVVTPCPRIVIIDDQGKSYQAVSIGIYSALKKVIQVFGAPTWEKPIPLQVKQITKGDRKMLTMNVSM
ncbi:MAG: hypothetical protein J6R32_07265 [Bacteroidales bacterium]|nr:hypothetical protein [Bacteroidales bacterium]